MKPENTATPTGSSACIGCGVILPVAEGPTHEYLESSAACWAAYGEVLAREYANPGLFQAVHRLTVDAYAVQHPGRPSPQSIQSVALHLMRLCVVLEGGSDAERAMKVIRGWAGTKGRFTWLTPPSSMGALTVVDVWKAADAAGHRKMSREWAMSAWIAWSGHHGTVRRWVSSFQEA